eukprot:gene1028-9932_t
MDGFEIEKIIGRGGQGTVFQGTKKETGKKVAIKKVPCEGISMANKAMREMLTIKSFQHRNLVEYSDLYLDINEETGDVFVCIIMPFYEFGDLENYIKQTYKEGNYLTSEEVIDFGLQICSCLEYLHGKDLMHRDLKPENIFIDIEIDKDGKKKKNLKVGDFGVAKQFNIEQNLTFVGTPSYMAPEIVSKNYDEKVDLFSVGAILYKLMTNKERAMWTDLTNNLEKTTEEIKQNVMKFDYPSELLNLTLNLLSLKPDVRLDAKHAHQALIKLSKSETSELSFLLIFPIEELERQYGVKFVDQLQRVFLNDSELTEFAFRSIAGENELLEEGAKYLATALEHNSNIKIINLQRTKIGVAGLKQLESYIARNKTIVEVKLAFNSIGDAGVESLKKCLGENFSIRTIDLSFNNIGKKGAQSIAEALTKNCETAESKTDWKDMVSSIEYGITDLNLNGNNIRAEGAKYLSESVAKISTLTTFNISANKLEPDGVKYIADSLKTNESIHTLVLNDNNMGTTGLKYLVDALKEGGEVKDGDDDDERCNIKHLIVRGNKLGLHAKLENKQSGNVGMKALRDMLKINQKIELLDFEDNALCNEDMKLFCEGLKYNTSVKHLLLSNNDIGDDGSKTIASYLLRTCPSLESLELAGNKIGSKGLSSLCAALEKIISLKSLDLSENKFGSDGAKHVANIFSLTNPNSSVFGFFTKKEASLPGSPSSKLLSIGKKKQHSSVILKPLRESFIKKLNLRGNDIGDVGIQIICEALKNNTTLEELDIQGNKIGEPSLKSITEYIQGSNCRLKYLNISGVKDRNHDIADGLPALVNALIGNETLTELHLDYCSLTSEEAECLAKLIKSDKIIQILSVAFNDIEQTGVEALIEALKENNQLKSLGIASCSVNRRIEKKMKQEDSRLDFGKNFDLD